MKKYPNLEENEHIVKKSEAEDLEAEKEKILDIYRSNFLEAEADFEIMFNIEYYAKLGFSIDKMSKLLNIKDLAKKITKQKHFKFAFDRGVLLAEAQKLTKLLERGESDINFQKEYQRLIDRNKVQDILKRFRTTNF